MMQIRLDEQKKLRPLGVTMNHDRRQIGRKFGPSVGPVDNPKSFLIRQMQSIGPKVVVTAIKLVEQVLHSVNTGNTVRRLRE